MEQLILVDNHDKSIGIAGKEEVHRKGLLHRAFSVIIFNKTGEMLLQQRALSKYHSAGLWSNACCGHPRPGEETKAAAQRRLKEEMGFSCNLKERFSFIYRVELDNLTEYEYDHVFTGVWEGVPQPAPDEAMDWKWIDMKELKSEIKKEPQKFSYWFKEIMKKTN